MLNYASSAAGKWSSLRTSSYAGSLDDVVQHIPEFERHSGANQHLDTVVRCPALDDHRFVPVGMVSRGYGLLQHRSVVDAVVEALRAVNVKSEEVAAALCLTEYGERMALSVTLPERFTFDPGDTYPMALRFECLNLVEGSTRFRALLGWYRLVCANGLIVGTTQYEMKMRHVGEVDMEGVPAVLRAGLETAEMEKKTLQAWRRVPVARDTIAEWVNGPVKAAWGLKAAARAWHITRTGADVTVTGPYKRATPTTIAVARALPVPGAPRRSNNLFDVSQALAWLARQRRDLQEQLAWREEIPLLIGRIAVR